MIKQDWIKMTVNMRHMVLVEMKDVWLFNNCKPYEIKNWSNVTPAQSNH